MSYDTWVRKPLGELSQIRRGSSPRPIVKYMAETGMPWVKIADATESNSRYIEKTNQFIKFEGVPRSVIVEPGELILSNSGTAGLPKFMGIKACIHDGWQVLRDFKDIDKSFLYYELLFIRSKLLHGAYDSSMKNLTLDMVRNFEIDLPPLQEQKAIASILSSLDDKIELNNKINKNLEELAQTLYKRWFVDFEFPNEEGLPYKSSGGKMVESELGLIPEGWNVEHLNNLFNFVGGSQPPKKEHIYEYKEGYVRFIQNRDYSGNNNHLTYIKESTRNKVCNKYDIMMDKYGEAGKVRFGIEGAYNVALAKIDTDLKYREFLRRYFEQKQIQNYILNSSQASTRPSVNASVFVNLKVVIPSNNLLEKFDKVSFDIIKKNLLIKEENFKLEKLRDLLLPKLMSGEIRVPIKE